MAWVFLFLYPTYLWSMICIFPSIFHYNSLPNLIPVQKYVGTYGYSLKKWKITSSPFRQVYHCNNLLSVWWWPHNHRFAAVKICTRNRQDQFSVTTLWWFIHEWLIEQTVCESVWLILRSSLSFNWLNLLKRNEHLFKILNDRSWNMEKKVNELGIWL